jgi:alanine racemase
MIGKNLEFVLHINTGLSRLEFREHDLVQIIINIHN